MPPQPLAQADPELLHLLRQGNVVVLTGAGISTDSGIPDYRGPSGRLRTALPMTYDRFVSSAEERRRYWARSHLGWQFMAAARPNDSHLAVARLEQAGLVAGVVTQNVDGLHTAAGSPDVLDLHGRLDAVVCLGCGSRRPRVEVGLRLDAVNPGFRTSLAENSSVVRPDGDVVVPKERVAAFRVVDCRVCGGVLKPDVVFFGEPVPRQRFAHGLALTRAAGALLVLGSSLAVGSGYRFVTTAASAGVPVAIVNRGATRGDRHAAVKVDALLRDVLPGLVTAVTAMAGAGAGYSGRE